MAFVVASQVLASIIVDQFGLLNLPVHPTSLARLGGAALVVAGVFVALRDLTTPLADAGVHPSFFVLKGLHWGDVAGDDRRCR